MQAVWLRRLVARPIRWITATTGGVGVGLALAFATASLLVDASLGGLASPGGLIAFVLISGILSAPRRVFRCSKKERRVNRRSFEMSMRCVYGTRVAFCT